MNRYAFTSKLVDKVTLDAAERSHREFAFSKSSWVNQVLGSSPRYSVLVLSSFIQQQFLIKIIDSYSGFNDHGAMYLYLWVFYAPAKRSPVLSEPFSCHQTT